MGTVTGYTADKINELLANGIVNAQVDTNNHLILTTRDGTVVDAGPVGGNTTVVGRQVGEPVFWLAPLSAPIPTGFLLLEGGTASRTTYVDLWNLWGTTHGAGDGVSTFGLPDMRKKAPVGYDSSDGWFDAIGKTGGETVHQLTAAESGLVAHNHGQAAHNHGQDAHNHGQAAHYHGLPGGIVMPSARPGSIGASTAAGSTYGFQYLTPPGGTAAMYLAVAINQAATATNQAATATNLANAEQNASTWHNNMPPFFVGRWIVKAAYTGAEINPSDSHVHAIADVTGLRAELDTLEADTGWVNMVLLAGTTVTDGYTPQYRRKNGKTRLRGRLTMTGSFFWDVPVGFQASVPQLVPGGRRFPVMVGQSGVVISVVAYTDDHKLFTQAGTPINLDNVEWFADQ